MLESSKYQTDCPDPGSTIGVVQANAIPFAGIDDVLAPVPPPQNIATVSIQLISVEHRAQGGDEVDTDFTLELTVTDGGQNRKGEFGPVNARIPVGGSFTANEFLPVMSYSSLAAAKIRFDFRAETDFLSGTFVGKTVGDDVLSPGVNLFVAPVVLESASRKSTLIFRGRVDVTVLEGLNS